MLFKKFFPKRDFFFDFFVEHAELSVQAARHLLLFKDPQQPIEEIFRNIRKLEIQADSVAHKCVEALHKTFITPMDRLDIHRLITTLDDVTDEIEDIAKLIFLYKIELNRKVAYQLAEVAVGAVEELLAVVKELRKMKITETLRRHFFAINHLENEADDLLNSALGTLFEQECEIKSLIKWKEIYEHLEKVTDVCEDAANIIEGIILENE